jgi:transposase
VSYSQIYVPLDSIEEKGGLMRESVTMNGTDQELYGWVAEVLGRRLSMGELSVLCGKSYRQCQRIVARVKAEGMLGVKHGNCGRSSKNRVSEELREAIRILIAGKYNNFNLTHLREKLLSEEQIIIARESLRKIAHTVGIPKKARRRRKKAYCLRPRMPKEGMLVQFDGSEHRWFLSSKMISTLIGGIDDATGKILALEFSCSEDTFSCFRVMRTIVENHGVPQAYYLDQAAHFGKMNREQNDTQIGRALSETGSKVILATAPQSKGRIERLWGTLQDRLISEMGLRGINRIPEANAYLRNEFIAEFNSKFGVEPREKELGYKAVPTGINLDLAFGIKELRKINANQSFSYQGTTYVLQTTQDLRYRTVEICSNQLEQLRFLVYGNEYTAIKAQDLKPKIFFKSAA